MRITIPRMTVRSWILVTAVVAVLMACERFRQRRTFFLGQAEAWASRVEDYGEGRGNLHFDRGDWSSDRIERFCDRMLDLSVELEKKYRFAADHPWLPLEPDPPFPDL